MQKEILLAHFPKSNFKRYQELMAAFSNLDNAWRAKSEDLLKIGWKEKLINEWLEWKNRLDVEKIRKILAQEKIYCITAKDALYPPLLKEIPDPPFCLFARGNMDKISYPLAVVGPRKYSPYGKQVTEDLVCELVHYGITIVSGLALGIDGIAHKNALRAGGRTIAVLGSGINKRHVCPTEHLRLSEQIIDSGGAVISEYPPGAIPSKFTFPKRNRIVAGMSMGTLVIEAGASSGALITAHCALDDNREVFVVPQNITSPTSAGGNSLLKTGATPVTEAKDILNSFNLQIIENNFIDKKMSTKSPAEEKIIKLLSREPIHVDEIIKKTSLSSQNVNSALTIMEMEGKARNVGNMMYILAK